jgi:hypothetical protein
MGKKTRKKLKRLAAVLCDMAEASFGDFPEPEPGGRVGEEREMIKDRNGHDLNYDGTHRTDNVFERLADLATGTASSRLYDSWLHEREVSRQHARELDERIRRALHPNKK